MSSKDLRPFGGFPFRDVRDFDRLFDFWPFAKEQETASYLRSFAPRAEVKETKDQFLVNFDLPGVSKEDINISIHDGLLTVSGERLEEKSETKGETVISEKSYGSFERSFKLPVEVNSELVEANYDNGVLKISLNKSQPSASRTIHIK